MSSPTGANAVPGGPNGSVPTVRPSSATAARTSGTGTPTSLTESSDPVPKPPTGIPAGSGSRCRAISSRIAPSGPRKYTDSLSQLGGPTTISASPAGIRSTRSQPPQRVAGGVGRDREREVVVSGVGWTGNHAQRRAADLDRCPVDGQAEDLAVPAGGRGGVRDGELDADDPHPGQPAVTATRAQALLT